MKLPYMNELAVSRETVDVFGGYNNNLYCRDGEFCDTENLTSDYYPVLSPRAPRGLFARPSALTGITAKDKLCCTDGTDFVIYGEDGAETRVPMGLSDEPKMLVSMGAYVIIMPDRKYVNTKDLTDVGEIDASAVTSGNVTFTLCHEDGTTHERIMATSLNIAEITDSVSDTFMWYDLSGEPAVLLQYYRSSSMWTAVDTFVKIAGNGISDVFKAGDGIEISGINDAALAGLNGIHTVTASGDGYIVISGSFLPTDEQITTDLSSGIFAVVTRTSSDTITLSRKMPEMDYICERGNRLWGCRYGMSADGEFVNEIYVSKAGDFKNWNSFAGSASDSYVMSVGSDGPFTGCAAFGDCTLFFKENRIHKVYGMYPSEYTSAEVMCQGAAAGSHAGIAAVDGVLYYKSRGGICAYDGSIPTEISAALGNVMYSDAVAGAHDGKYYISMCDGAGAWHLFVYDTLRAMWHREDGSRVDGFASLDGVLYMSIGGVIKTYGVGGDELVKWSAVTGLIGAESPERKYISKLCIRMSKEPSSIVRFYIQYDSSNVWEYIAEMTGAALRTFTVPIKLRRCDHLRLRIDGEGDAKIYSITKTIEEGSTVT